MKTDTHLVPKTQRAGKRHRCSAVECERPIDIGEAYVRVVEVPNGEEHTDESVRAQRLPVFKYHVACWRS